MLDKMSYLRTICRTHYHRTHIVIFCYFAPVDTFFQAFFEYEIEPDTSTSSVPLHERMSHIHLDILVYYGIEGILWHLLDL